MDNTAHDSRFRHLECLRGEARFLAAAGMILLAVALPLTLVFVAAALGRAGASPLLPLVVGAPPTMIGYLSCHYASRRLAKLQLLERVAGIGSPEPNLLANS
jgi:hypothetical protein